MKDIKTVKLILSNNKANLSRKYFVSNLGLFGSYVRGEQNEESDVDITVEFSEPVGFLFFHLANFLEKILDANVDLITPDAIKPNRQKYIMEDLVYV